MVAGTLLDPGRVGVGEFTEENRDGRRKKRKAARRVRMETSVWWYPLIACWYSLCQYQTSRLCTPSAKLAKHPDAQTRAEFQTKGGRTSRLCASFAGHPVAQNARRRPNRGRPILTFVRGPTSNANKPDAQSARQRPNKGRADAFVRVRHKLAKRPDEQAPEVPLGGFGLTAP